MALEDRSLVRVLGALTVTPVPGAAPEVLGVAQVEGEPVIVVDLARLAGEIPAASASVPGGVQVRVGDTGETVVLAVDEAVGFVDVTSAAITAVAGEGLFPANTVVEGRTVAVMDPRRFAPEAE